MREDTTIETPEETPAKVSFLSAAKSWLAANWPTLAGVAVGTGLAAYLLAKREGEPEAIESGDGDTND